MRLARAAAAAGEPSKLYFSFGANMSPLVLERYNVQAIRSVPGRLPEWRLTFDYLGYEGVEPRFANLAPLGPASAEGPGDVAVHGVAHELPAGALAIIDEVEDEGVSYTRQELAFESYEGEHLRAWAYVAWPRWVSPGLPSQRYLQVLRQGAERHGLRPEYLRWLAAQPCLRFCDGAAAAGCPSADGGLLPGCGTVDWFHSPADTPAEACSPLRIAGRSYWLPRAILQQRSFLRAMASAGGTCHALRLLSLAYPEHDAGRGGQDSLQEDQFTADSWAETLSPLQRDYVLCWVKYFDKRFAACSGDPRSSASSSPRA